MEVIRHQYTLIYVHICALCTFNPTTITAVRAYKTPPHCSGTIEACIKSHLLVTVHVFYCVFFLLWQAILGLICNSSPSYYATTFTIHLLHVQRSTLASSGQINASLCYMSNALPATTSSFTTSLVWQCPWHPTQSWNVFLEIIPEPTHTHWSYWALSHITLVIVVGSAQIRFYEYNTSAPLHCIQHCPRSTHKEFTITCLLICKIRTACSLYISSMHVQITDNLPTLHVHIACARPFGHKPWVIALHLKTTFASLCSFSLPFARPIIFPHFPNAFQGPLPPHIKPCLHMRRFSPRIHTCLNCACTAA